jgi:hypothetical protein
MAGRSGNGRPVLLCNMRIDAERAGVISLCASMRSARAVSVVSDADSFKPSEGYAEGE